MKIDFIRGVSLLCALATAPALAQQSRLSPELLESRILGVRDSTELDETTKVRLIGLYNQSITNIETTRTFEGAIEEYRQAERTGPIEIETLRASMERRRITDPTEELSITDSSPIDVLERRLDEERANLIAVGAALAALEARLEAESQRPGQARERIAASRLLLDEATGVTEFSLSSRDNPLLAEATRWAIETRASSLQTEIRMLDQELSSQRVRLGVLRVQRDDAALRATRMATRISALRSAVNERRRGEVELAMSESTAALEGGESSVIELAAANLALVAVLEEQLTALESLTDEESRVRPLTMRLTEAFRSTRRKLELRGSNAPLGLAIREQRRQLPNAAEYAQDRRALHEVMTEVSLRLIENEDERRSLNDLDAYLEDRVGDAARADAEALARARRSLLDRAIANDNAYQRRLYSLDDNLRRLEERTIAYDAFLAERLLWVRSERGIDREAWATLPEEVAAFASSTSWLEATRATALKIVRAPMLLAAIVVSGLLFLRRKRIHEALLERGRNVGHIAQDRMQDTFEAILLTLLLALPAPLAAATLGRALATIADPSPFTVGMASAFSEIVLLLLLLLVLRGLFVSGGVADRHFGWNRQAIEGLRANLSWFVALGVPLVFVAVHAAQMNPATAGGTLGALSFIAFIVVWVGFIVSIGHPKKATIGSQLEGAPKGGRWWRQVWFPLTVSIPLVLAGLALFGYTHAVSVVVRRSFESTLLLGAVWVARAVVQRWLLMTRRRLVYDAAIAAHEARQIEADDDSKELGSGEEDIGVSEVNLVALDTDSRRLLDAAMALVAVLGLAGIWGNVFPALRILWTVTLWSRRIVADGVELVAPVTLGDVLLAVVIGVGGYILAKDLPSLIDIILLKSGKATAGGRYALSTLLRYAIVAIVALMVLDVLGASWSQLSWAAAALGVGIGFGLQEIVANFICGLIILFERPVRVGDVVTIGDASGTVSRIRIRATTIRDWDRKELLVPNKELVTGRVVNWTLSDDVIRLLIKVGVAYGSDVRKAMDLMYEVAHENERVLEDLVPVVNFEEFGDNSLSLSLRAYVGALSDRLPVLTEIHLAIDQKFREAGIEIAFPQLDLHLRSAPTDSAPEMD